MYALEGKTIQEKRNPRCDDRDDIYRTDHGFLSSCRLQQNLDIEAYAS